MSENRINKDRQYYKFCAYGFFKNLKFFDPFFMLFLRDTGISFLAIGALYSIREISVNIMEIPSGFLADHLGRRKAMIFSFAAYIISFILFYFFSSYILLSLAMILFAVGEAFRTGTHKAMILDYLKSTGQDKNKTEYYGHTRSMSQIGSAVSALIAAILVFYTGSYRTVFLWSIIPYLIDMILITSYPASLDGLDEKGKVISWKKTIKETFDFSKDFIKSSNGLKGIFSTSSFSGFFKTIKDYIQPLIKYMALSIPFALYLEGDQRTGLITGFVYIILYLINSYGARHSASICRLFKSSSSFLNASYIAAATLIAASGFALMMDVSILPVIFLVGLSFLENIRRPVAVTFLSDRLEHKIMATGLSVESQLQTLFVIVLAPLLGVLIDFIGLGPSILITGIVMGLLSLFIQLPLDPQE